MDLPDAVDTIAVSLFSGTTPLDTLHSFQSPQNFVAAVSCHAAIVGRGDVSIALTSTVQIVRDEIPVDCEHPCSEHQPCYGGMRVHDQVGIGTTQRFVRKEPLRRTHECVFGVLAHESEPMDARV